MTQMSLREGDVLKYETRRDGCREGLALVHRSPTELSGYVAVDTYWQDGLDLDLNDGHVLSEQEIASASVLFNIADYERIHQPEKVAVERWRRYRPEDRASMTSKHGNRTVYLVKRGAATVDDAA